MPAETAKPLTLADVEPGKFYTQTQFAEIREVHVTTVANWLRKFKRQLPRSRDGKFLGATILRFCGRDARKLATPTISDAELQKRADAAQGRVKAMA